MQFSELLIQILDTNNKVFIPTIGELEYDKSKIILNPNATSTGYELVISVAKKLNLPVDEAEKYINQEVEIFRRQLNENGEVSFGTKGRLKLRNGEYSFEEKGKQLFPSDFFGGQTNLDITPKKEVIIVETTPEVEKEPISLVSPEEEKLIEELPKEEQESVREVVEQVNAGVPADEIFDDVLEETTMPPVDEVKEEVQTPIIKDVKEEVQALVIEEEIIQTTPEDDVQELINDIDEVSDQQAHQFTEDNPNVHVHTIITEEVVQETAPVDEGEDFIHTIENASDYQAQTNSEFSLLDNDMSQPIEEDLELDESNIDDYDKGHYEYLLKKNTSVKNNWNKIGAALILFFGVAFMLPWIWASFQGNKFLGMDPLWTSAPKKTAKTDIVPPAVVKTDSTSLKADSTKATTMKGDTASLANKNKPVPVTPATTPTTPAKPLATQTPTKPAVTKTTPTPTATKPKTLSQTTPTSKPSRVINVNSNTTSVKDTSNGTGKIKEKPKPREKVQGAPYATANYTKGNHYVSFGGFSVPKNAIKLKNDLKSLGVVTDIVLVDGMYRVVIPYTSRQHATLALKEYPNTVIID